MAYVRKKTGAAASAPSDDSKQSTDEKLNDEDNTLPEECDDSLLLQRYISQIPSVRCTRQSRHQRQMLMTGKCPKITKKSKIFLHQ